MSENTLGVKDRQLGGRPEEKKLGSNSGMEKEH